MLTHTLAALVVLAFAPPEVGPPAPPAAVPGDPAVVAPALGEAAEAEPEATDPLGEALTPVPGGLTADYVAQKALEVSPQVEISEAEVQRAAAQLDQTIVSYLPQLSASASYTRLSDVNVRFGSGALVGAGNPGLLGTGPCPGNPTATCVVDAQGEPVGAASFRIPQVLNQFSTQASLSIPISDYVFRAFSGINAAKNNRKAAQLRKAAELRKIGIDARVVFYNWARAVSQVAVAEDAIRSAEARLGDADLGFRVGTVTKADKLRIEALVAQARRVLSDAQALELVTRENLAVIMNEPVREYGLGEDFTAPADIGEVPELEILVDRSFDQRPELQAISTTNLALRQGIRTERAGYAPRLEAFGDAIYANPNPRFFPPTEEWNATWAVGARLSWSINTPLATRMRIRELKAEGRTLEGQYEALRRGIHLEVTQAYADRQRAIAAMGYARISRDASAAAYEAVAARFQAGRATATDVIVSQQELVNAQFQDINARIDLEVAQAKLEYAVGDSP